MLPARLILRADPSLQRLPARLAQPFLLQRLLGAASHSALPEVEVGLLPRGVEVAEVICPKELLLRHMRWRRLKGQGASASLPRRCFCRRDFRASSPELSSAVAGAALRDLAPLRRYFVFFGAHWICHSLHTYSPPSHPSWRRCRSSCAGWRSPIADRVHRLVHIEKLWCHERSRTAHQDPG